MHIVIIGAGVLGCAIARHVRQRYPMHDVTVLEAQAGPGLVTSKHNSGVLHAGMHLKPGSLKATLAQRGRQYALDFCRRKGITVQQSGMLIAGTWRDGRSAFQQAPEFIRILRQGKRLGIHLQVLFPWQMRKREPQVRGLIGIVADDVAIVDREQYVAEIFNDACAAGATFAFSTPVTAITRGHVAWEVQTPHGLVRADVLINAAGTHAQTVASWCGVKHTVLYVRGEYAEVVGGNQGRFLSLVYPTPRPGEGGLGVHITPTVDGRLLLGPNTVPVQQSDDYGDIVPRAPLGFFRDRVAPFWPDVRNVQLTFGPAGIRTKSAGGDFVFHLQDQALHILGYESPGFTAALAAAEHCTHVLSL